MEKVFHEQIDGLLEKYAELLIGDTSEEWMEKVKVWAIYSHIAKSMPALAKHWNAQYPEAKQQLIGLINEIKEKNEEHRNKK